MTAVKPTNRLAQETSPYLLQHAHNPVDWYPWGEEAFARARRRKQAHSALRRLFRLPLVPRHGARKFRERGHRRSMMNRDFICIKVDREERPDVDAIYMSAVQMMTGQGGWPMTMFLTPDGKPFYGGTYFPPQDLYGRPGFPRVLEAVARRVEDAAHRESRRRATRCWQHLDKGNDLTPRSARQPAHARRAGKRLSTRLSAVVRPAVRRLRHGAQVSAARATWIFCCASMPAASGRNRWQWWKKRCSTWRSAASTISWAADSTATAPIRRGSCRTSRRCSTTTPSWRRPTPARIRRPAKRFTKAWRRRRWSTCCAK